MAKLDTEPSSRGGWLRGLASIYLQVRRTLDSRFLDRALIRVFGGVHPKNVFNYRWEFFAEHVSSDDVVIDVGCGTGLILSKITSKIKAGYGLDHDPKLEKYWLAFPHGDNIKPVTVDWHSFDFEAFARKTGYGVAIFSHVLEHIEDVPALLKRVKAARLLICVPSQENWRTQLLIHWGLPFMTDPTHFREYTRAMLRAELEVVGYRVLEMGFNAEGEIVCSAVAGGEPV
ncbi:MAG: class I SAM-dependent methyltransferase [Candidatus Omnitrophota bacterium]